MVALEILRELLAPAWRLFTETPVPGLSSDLLFVSFADLFLGVFLIRISLGLLNSVLGIGLGSSYRSGSNKNPKIAEARKGDEY